MKLTKFETIYGQVPSKANGYMVVPDNAGGKRIIKGNEIREYERNFMRQCSIYAGRQILGRFRLLVTVYECSNHYDLDNALKTILDCLQYAKAISNDNLCTEIAARKVVDARNPRIVYAIEEVDAPLELFDISELNKPKRRV